MGSMLDSIREDYKSDDGLCKTCAHLVQVIPGAIGCEVHDRLIMPEYPPYSTRGFICPDWAMTEEEMNRREQRRATRETEKSDAKLNFTNASLANTLNETAHKAFIRGVEQGISQGVTSTVSAYTIALVEAYNFTEQQARDVFDTVSKEVFGNMSRTKETKPGQFTLDELKDMAKNCGVEA